jgi:deazaflavin-dependent oxidoreductase (nitroreductase family)
MGVLSQLGYTTKPANVVQRGVQKLAASRPGAWAFQRTLYAIDRPLFRASNGRWSGPGILAGVPVIMLTTTGAKTGLPRSMPLVGIPLGDDRDDLALIGSNYGQQHTPGWVYNLEADPHATVAYRERSVAVVARPATADETEAAFEIGARIYPGYAKYRERAAHRTIRVFVLEPAS